MDILIKASQLILSLSILVVLHELGHFIPAKLFKTRVENDGGTFEAFDSLLDTITPLLIGVFPIFNVLGWYSCNFVVGWYVKIHPTVKAQLS